MKSQSLLILALVLLGLVGTLWLAGDQAESARGADSFGPAERSAPGTEGVHEREALTSPANVERKVATEPRVERSNSATELPLDVRMARELADVATPERRLEPLRTVTLDTAEAALLEHKAIVDRVLGSPRVQGALSRLDRELSEKR